MKTENSQHNDEQLLLKKEILCRRQLEEIKKIRQTIKGASEEYYRILQNKLENKLVEINTQKVSVAWFASGFIGRSASGTAQTTRKLVEFLLEHKFEQIEVNLIVKSVGEANLIKNDQVLSKSIVVILPDVHGNFLRSSRQLS